MESPPSEKEIFSSSTPANRLLAHESPLLGLARMSPWSMSEGDRPIEGAKSRWPGPADGEMDEFKESLDWGSADIAQLASILEPKGVFVTLG